MQTGRLIPFLILLTVFECSEKKTRHFNEDATDTAAAVEAVQNEGVSDTATDDREITVDRAEKPFNADEYVSSNYKIWVTEDRGQFFNFSYSVKEISHYFTTIGKYENGIVYDIVSGDSVGSYRLHDDKEKITINFEGKQYDCYKTSSSFIQEYRKIDSTCTIELLKDIGFSFDFGQGTCDYRTPDSIALKKIKMEHTLWDLKKII